MEVRLVLNLAACLSKMNDVQMSHVVYVSREGRLVVGRHEKGKCECLCA